MTKTAEQQRYQAEEDAYTMARYQELMRDKGRVKRAVSVAKQRADDLKKQADTMSRVSKVKVTTSTKKTKKK